MYHGILVVNKEKGFTSHDVVGKLRGILKQKKIGHTGTLDPDAEGVLPVCLGKATKVCDMLTDSDKIYEAVIKLGVETDTQDLSGRVLSENDAGGVSEDIFKAAAEGFIGEYGQIPPMYSALKVNGKKLYEYAREGIEIERKPRKVLIKNIDFLFWDENNKEAGFRVECSKGTYIRTLCHDMGKRIGCGGAMKSLIRTKAAGFTIEESHRLGDIEASAKGEISNNGDDGKTPGIEKWIIPIDRVFEGYPALRVKAEGKKLLENGNMVPGKFFEEIIFSNLADAGRKASHSANNGGKVRVYDENGEFKALYELKNGVYYPVKMFL